MKYFLIPTFLLLFACGSETKNEEETPQQECKKSDEAQAMNVCTFKFPIQETGFMCPQGTPYLHQFEEAAVCSEDPRLSEGQSDIIKKDGVLECGESESEFCLPLTVSEQRNDDCDKWMLDTTCLESAESDALKSACESAAIGASNLDWRLLGDCSQVDNSSQLGGGDFCIEISACLGENLRVCHTYNDQCFNLRPGRLASCDILAECSDDVAFRDTCDQYVGGATIEEYNTFKKCADLSNNATEGSTICEDKLNCANALLGVNP